MMGPQTLGSLIRVMKWEMDGVYIPPTPWDNPDISRQINQTISRTDI
ncbi:MAG: hypothetical protein WC836_00530 [Desulfobacula sp.]|jgi:hypothetical protein